MTLPIVNVHSVSFTPSGGVKTVHC